MGGFISGLDGVPMWNFTQNEIRVRYNKAGGGSYGQKYILPIEVSCRADFNGKPCEWNRAREAYHSSHTELQPRQIARVTNKQAGFDNSILPLRSYQSASRTGGTGVMPFMAAGSVIF